MYEEIKLMNKILKMRKKMIYTAIASFLASLAAFPVMLPTPFYRFSHKKNSPVSNGLQTS